MNNLKIILYKTHHRLCTGTFAVIFAGNSYSMSRIVNLTNSDMFGKFENFMDLLPIVVGKSIIYAMISPAFVPYALGKWLTSDKVMISRKIREDALPKTINQNGLWPHIIPNYGKFYKVDHYVPENPIVEKLYERRQTKKIFIDLILRLIKNRTSNL